jgi:hypothetical protein
MGDRLSCDFVFWVEACVSSVWSDCIRAYGNDHGCFPTLASSLGVISLRVMSLYVIACSMSDDFLSSQSTTAR